MPDSGASGTDDATRQELERLRARVAELEARRPPRHRVRSLAAVVLIVLGCLLAPLSVMAAWTADTVGDTDRYVDTVAPLAGDRNVRNEAATRVTNAVMQHLDLPALLEGVAPAQRPLVDKALGRLGDSLEGAVRSFVYDKALAVVSSDVFRQIWTEANRRIHGALNEALTGRGTVRLENDSVIVDLGPVVEQVKQHLVDAGMTVAGKIPRVHAELTVLTSDDIGKAKTYFRLLQLAGLWLPVAAVLLVAGGVLLSGHRRRALIAASLCFAFTTLLLGVALTIFRVMYLDSLPLGVSPPTAESVYNTLTRFLRTSVRVVVALGVVIAVAAWLTGPGRRAVLVRRLWYSGIHAVRATADRAGLRTGPVGPFLHRFRTWITWLLVAATVLTYVLWPYPTGWVVIGLALTLLFALSVVDFVAEDGAAETQTEG